MLVGRRVCHSGDGCASGRWVCHWELGVPPGKQSALLNPFHCWETAAHRPRQGAWLCWRRWRDRGGNAGRMLGSTFQRVLNLQEALPNSQAPSTSIQFGALLWASASFWAPPRREEDREREDPWSPNHSPFFPLCPTEASLDSIPGPTASFIPPHRTYVTHHLSLPTTATGACSVLARAQRGKTGLWPSEGTDIRIAVHAPSHSRKEGVLCGLEDWGRHALHEGSRRSHAAGKRAHCDVWR